VLETACPMVRPQRLDLRRPPWARNDDGG